LRYKISSKELEPGLHLLQHTPLLNTMDDNDDTRIKKGYQRLGEYMAWDPNQAVFCRFRAANMFTLLLFQAEIAELEEQLDDAIAKDDRSGDAEKRRYRYCKDWARLREVGQDSVQWEKVMELRGKIAAYSKITTQFLRSRSSAGLTGSLKTKH
jgi:hypothetical protein